MNHASKQPTRLAYLLQGSNLFFVLFLSAAVILTAALWIYDATGRKLSAYEINVYAILLTLFVALLLGSSSIIMTTRYNRAFPKGGRGYGVSK